MRLQWTLHLHMSSSTSRLRQLGTQHQHMSRSTPRQPRSVLRFSCALGWVHGACARVLRSTCISWLYVALAPIVGAAPVPIVEDIAPVPAVSYAAPAPVGEYMAPAPAIAASKGHWPAVASRTSRGTSKAGVCDQFQAKLMHGGRPQHPGSHRERSGHGERCDGHTLFAVHSERAHAGLVRVVPNPLLAASFDHAAAVSGICRPTLAASSTELRWIAELSHARPISNFPPVLEQKAAVTGAVRTTPVTHLFLKTRERGTGWVGRHVVR